MSALSDRMAGMTRKQAHELNDREAINEFDRLAAEREREDAPPLKERQASWGETREELIALRAELSALKARPSVSGERVRRIGNIELGARLSEGWYPSHVNPDGNSTQGHVHDRHVISNVRTLEQTCREAAEEIDALNARLAALEARRCDGCAHAAPKWRYYPNDGLRCARLHADVPVDFSCAAWTEKP